MVGTELTINLAKMEREPQSFATGSERVLAINAGNPQNTQYSNTRGPEAIEVKTKSGHEENAREKVMMSL